MLFRTVVILLLALIGMCGNAQGNFDLIFAHSKDSVNCLKLSLESNSIKDQKLFSQNYRIFYDYSIAEFTGFHISQELEELGYAFQTVIDAGSLNIDIDGMLPFEETIGFLSINVTLNGTNAARINCFDRIEIAEICFSDAITIDDVVNATMETTTEYFPIFTVLDGDMVPEDEQMGNCENFVLLDTLLDINVFLEGPYQDNGRMSSKLNYLGYLPGQTPSTFFGKMTQAGHPYSGEPWNYDNNDGDNLSNYNINIVDYLLISIREELALESEICRSAAVLDERGNVYVDFKNRCPLIPNEGYYIAVQHRNHLPVISHERINFNQGRLSYDFTTQDSYTTVFSNGQKEIDPGIYAMYGGNIDQVNSLSARNDINTEDLSQLLLFLGDNSLYSNADVDLNADINVNDLSLIIKNFGIFSEVKF